MVKNIIFLLRSPRVLCFEINVWLFFCLHFLKTYLCFPIEWDTNGNREDEFRWKWFLPQFMSNSKAIGKVLWNSSSRYGPVEVKKVRWLWLTLFILDQSSRLLNIMEATEQHRYNFLCWSLLISATYPFGAKIICFGPFLALTLC